MCRTNILISLLRYIAKRSFYIHLNLQNNDIFLRLHLSFQKCPKIHRVPYSKLAYSPKKLRTSPDYCHLDDSSRSSH